MLAYILLSDSYCSYIGGFSDVIILSKSAGSSSRRKCCWLSSGMIENSIPVSSCVDMVEVQIVELLCSVSTQDPN